MEKEKRVYTKIGMYPNCHKIAKDFIINDRNFKVSGWKVEESRHFVILRGIFYFRIRFDTLEEVPFGVYFPKKNPSPRKNAIVKFPTNNRTKYLSFRYNLKTYIAGFFLEKMDASDHND